MKHFALVAALMAAPLPATAASLDSFSDIFVFGDSLSDPGNLFNALTGTPSSPVSPLYPNGQITDGDTWASQIGADFDSGRNFAFAAARAAPRDPIEFAFPDLSTPDPSDEVSLGTLNVPDFGEQIALYQDAGPTLGPTPLAAIWFGGNDLRDAFAAPDEASAQAIITAAITSIVGGAAALAGEGFSTIAVFGAPNLGRIPEVLARGPDAALAAANVSALFNDTLRAALRHDRYRLCRHLRPVRRGRRDPGRLRLYRYPDPVPRGSADRRDGRMFKLSFLRRHPPDRGGPCADRRPFRRQRAARAAPGGGRSDACRAGRAGGGAAAQDARHESERIN